jgi:hypothetical protein
MPPAGLLGPPRLRQPGRPASSGRSSGHGRPRTWPPSSACSTPDATAIANGGGLVSAALRPIQGGEQVARAYIGITRRAPDLTILERTVNGQPGLIAQQDGVTVTVLAFAVAGGRITHIWAIRNPDKLRPWTTG